MSNKIKENNLFIAELMDQLPDKIFTSLVNSWLKGKESASSLVNIIEMEILRIAPHDDIRISSYNSLVLAMNLVKAAIKQISNNVKENNE